MKVIPFCLCIWRSNIQPRHSASNETERGERKKGEREKCEREGEEIKEKRRAFSTATVGFCFVFFTSAPADRSCNDEFPGE